MSAIPCGAPALLAQLVEHLHGKEGVSGSSPELGLLAICTWNVRDATGLAGYVLAG